MFAIAAVAIAIAECVYASPAGVLPFNSWQPLVTARMDPIITPGGISEHTHHVIGGSAFSMRYDPDALRKSKCSTLRIQEDKSNYWTPNLYIRLKNGSFVTMNPQTRVYYTFPDANLDPSLSYVPFPYNFQMITGSPMRKTYSDDIPTDTEQQFYCAQDPNPGIEAPNPDVFFKGRGLPQIPCTTVITKTWFPSCWNGNAYDPAHPTAHVAYAGVYAGVWADTCPPGYKYRLPQILLETFFRGADFGANDGTWDKYIFSNGDTTGFGLHADFQNGWNQDLLTQMMNGCRFTEHTDPPEKGCPILAASADEPASKLCTLEGPKPNEQTTGMLAALPGCNLEWGDTPTKPTCPGSSGQTNSSQTGSGASGGGSGNVIQIPINSGQTTPLTPGPRIISLFQPKQSKRILGLFKPRLPSLRLFDAVQSAATP